MPTVEEIIEEFEVDWSFHLFGMNRTLVAEAMDKRVESRYNKGSNDIPIEECGPANHRLFAREVAAETPFDVFCKPHAVFVLHHFRDEYNELDYYATHYGMVEVDVINEESMFVHESRIEEWKDA